MRATCDAVSKPQLGSVLWKGDIKAQGLATSAGRSLFRNLASATYAHFVAESVLRLIQQNSDLPCAFELCQECFAQFRIKGDPLLVLLGDFVAPAEHDGAIHC